MLLATASCTLEDNAGIADPSAPSNPANEAPITVDDVAVVSSTEDLSSIDVVSNDMDMDGDTLQLESVEAPVGEVSINGDGTLSFTYPEDEEVTGDIEITYTVTDGDSTSTGTLQLSLELSATLEWEAPLQRMDGGILNLSEIAGYEISFRPVGAPQFEFVLVEDNTATQYDVVVPAPGEYEFRLAVVDTDGLHSDFSDSITADISL